MKFLNALNKIPGIGPQKLKLLLNYFPDAEAAWKSDRENLIRSGLKEKIAEKLLWEKRNLSPDQEWEKIQKENIRLIKFTDPEFPQSLKEIYNPPFLLYAKGKLNLNSPTALAIVGSRKCTPYGIQVAFNISKELARSNLTIVSGMALGIDSSAHKGALFAQGKTLAVLGNSLDEKSIYPRYNLKLAHEICEEGALLSEYPPETAAGPLTFPARNRIIAGLSLGTLVVEASEKSGALITAKLALEYNREVFAVPGSIFSHQSAGTNNLLQKGAKLVSGVKDILEELNIFDGSSEKNFLEKKERLFVNEKEKRLWEILSNEPVHFDKIKKIMKIEASEISAILSILEIKGWIKNIGGQNYIII